MGIFGQAKYDYNDTYTFDFTLRRDGHSRFGSDVRFGTFGAASVGWRLSSMQFLENVTWLDNLRLRASYGITGNSLIPNFASQTLVASAGQYVGSPGLVLSQLGNNLLTWEEAETFNFGLDATLFNGRIISTIDVWRKNSSNLLFSTPLPADSGFGSITQNTGELRNQGIDFDIQTVNLSIGKFQWTTAFNMTLLENEVISLFGDEERIGNSIVVGQPLSPIYITPFVGINPANGRPMYLDEKNEYTYTIRDADVRYLGSALPTSYGGLSNTFTYGGLSLEIFFQGQFGNLAFNADLFNLASTGSGPNNQLVNQLNYWKQPGDVVSNPMPWESGARPGGSSYVTTSTRQLSDGSYVRLKQVTLSYSIPTGLSQRIGIAQADLLVQGLNLATFTKFNGIDPEVNSIGNTYAAFPNSQQISAGVNLSF